MIALTRLVIAGMLIAIAVSTAIASTHADASGNGASTPEGVVDHVVTQALQRIAESGETLEADRAVARAIFDDEVLPWIDTDLMARFAMGPAARRADPADIERLSNALAERVANLYSGALQRYANEAVDFAADGKVTLRTVTEDDRRAIVMAQVRGPHVEDLNLRIQLYQRDARWRVFDIESSGVSILLVFRDALQSAAGRDGGVDAMIAALEQGAVNVEQAWEEAEDNGETQSNNAQ